MDIALRAPDPRVYHIDVRDPAGEVVSHYSGNFRQSSRWPVAHSDAAGTWKLHIRDALTGWSTVREVEVE